MSKITLCAISGDNRIALKCVVTPLWLIYPSTGNRSFAILLKVKLNYFFYQPAWPAVKRETMEKWFLGVLLSFLNRMAMDLVLSFPDEHQRILRALHDSLDRESDAQRLLRRMKESLVGTALRLQVAVKTVQDDEMTMQQLRRELEDMRKEAKSAAAAHEDAGSPPDAPYWLYSCLNRRICPSLALIHTST